MLYKKNIISTLLLAILFLGCGSGQKAVPTMPESKKDETDKTAIIDNTKQTITPKSYQKMLGVGMDVDWAKTDAGREAAKAARSKGVNVPELFKKRGLDHVRIRVKDDVNSDESLLDEIEALVDEALNSDLIPIVAYQAREFKDNPNSNESLEHVKKWWQKVANRFKDKNYKLAFDLIIENTGAVKKANDRLNLLYKEVTKAIHDIDEKRILIIAPNKISNPFELANLVVPEPDDFIMVEWHFYAAGPKKDNPKKKWTTGTPEEKKLITDKIDYALAWSKEHQIPTWVGAWMANNYNDVNADATYPDGAPAGGDYNITEQKVFASFMVQKLRDAKIPYAINSDTKYFDRINNGWYDSVGEVLDVILGR